MKRLTTHQHQMLEDLTGQEYTVYGVLRKNKRSGWQTEALGLTNTAIESAKRQKQILNKCTEQRMDENQAFIELKKEFPNANWLSMMLYRLPNKSS